MAQKPGTNIMPSGGGSSEGEQEPPESLPVPVVGDLLFNEDKPDDTQLIIPDEVGGEDNEEDNEEETPRVEIGQGDNQEEESRPDEVGGEDNEEDNEEETPRVEIGQGDNQEEESRPFVRTSPERERVRREANPPQSLLAHVVEFCKQNRAAILIALFALATVAFPVWVGVARSNTSVQQNNEIKSQNDKIKSQIDKIKSQNDKVLSYFQNRKTRQELDSCRIDKHHLKEELEKTKHDQRERELFFNQTACTDWGSTGNPIVHCNLSSCKDHRLDGKETPFHVIGTEDHVNFTFTIWFPSDCLNSALREVLCFTDRGEFAVRWDRDHPNCPGKKQYQCLSSGRHRDYVGHDPFRDVYAKFKTCLFLARH